MKKLPAALKEILETAEQEDRDELAAILSCYGNPDNSVLPAIWCLSRADAVKRLVAALGVGGVLFTTDHGVEAMAFADAVAMRNFIDAVRPSDKVYEALTSGGLDAVAALRVAEETPRPPSPARPELSPESVRSRLLSVFASCQERMSPDDARDVHAALAWCEVGSSVLPPVWALERLGMAVSDDREPPCTAVGCARGCLVRHLRAGEVVPGLNLMLSSCPHDLYTLKATGGDDSNPLVGYLYSCAAAAKDLLPDAEALLALDSCPLNLPEGKELETMKAIVQDPSTMWARLLGRMSKALQLDVTGFLYRNQIYGPHQPSTLNVASPVATNGSPVGPESKALASAAAALLVGVVLRPCRTPGRPKARVRTGPADWAPTVPVQADAGGAAMSDADALRLWFAETHALDEPADPPTCRDDDANAVLDTADPRWERGRAAAFYGAVVSILFAYGNVSPKCVAGTAKRLRPGAVVTAAYANVFVAGASGSSPDAMSLELVVETNVNAAAHYASVSFYGNFVDDLATAFLCAFFGGATTSEEIFGNIGCARIPCDPDAWSAVERRVGPDAAGVMFDIAANGTPTPSGNAARLRRSVAVERLVDDNGRLSLAFLVRGGYLGDLLVALAAARRTRPFQTKGLARVASSGLALFVPTNRGGYADAARYAAVASRIAPHLSAVVPLNRTPRYGFSRQAYVEDGARLTVGTDAEDDELSSKE